MSNDAIHKHNRVDNFSFISALRAFSTALRECTLLSFKVYNTNQNYYEDCCVCGCCVAVHVGFRLILFISGFYVSECPTNQPTPFAYANSACYVTRCDDEKMRRIISG